MAVRFDIITIFPGMFSSVVSESIVGRAVKSGLVEINRVDLRDFTEDKHRSVDDRPYGGGPGMILEAEPIYQALQTIGKAHTIELSPGGTRLDRQVLRRLAPFESITLICGRYEGIDKRIEAHIDEKISIGDYVLSGGEIPALVLIDALARLQPGVIQQDSVCEDSFEQGLLDHTHYTRPESWRGKQVPSVLLSGHHNKIADHRLMQSLGQTWLNRPDLLINRKINERELALLVKFVQNHERRGEDYE